ncbi:MAG: murein L,D-transpeptidase catalytic domain family protein [Pirellulaceae bacterium]|nr:murein L,D-transpeptidase catalytic domain family protein [Pirellulaceae bacterium]
MAAKKYLSASVGLGGENRPGDVAVVRYLLNRHIQMGVFKGRKPIDEQSELESRLGDPTIDLILEVQREILKLPPAKADGVVSPNGDTIKWIKNSPTAAKTKDDIEEIMDLANDALQDGPRVDVKPDLWESALDGLKKHAQDKRLTKPHILTLVDFRIELDLERMWTIDLRSPTKLVKTRVAHGSGPPKSKDPVRSPKFSNGNYRSSVGSYITRFVFVSDVGLDEHKTHKIGPALKLIGMDKTNSRAFERGILFHSGWYMENRVGRSYGFFVTDWDTNHKLCHLIADGSFVHAVCRKEDKQDL